MYTSNIPPMTKKSTRINRVGQGFVCVEKAGGRRVEGGWKGGWEGQRKGGNVYIIILLNVKLCSN